MSFVQLIKCLEVTRRGRGSYEGSSPYTVASVMIWRSEGEASRILLINQDYDPLTVTENAVLGQWEPICITEPVKA